MKKFLLVLAGIIIVSTSAFSIESDFKNSLLKVDFTKVGQDNYNIQLYTQKPYNEPIKVIKKTNTNYYLLLPETFHSVTSVAPVGDIKNVEVKLFPYAGQDLNNGYTKINIYTTKPVNINTSLKTASGAVAPSIDTKKLAQLDSAFNTKQAQERQAQLALQQKQLQEQKARTLKEQQAKEAELKAQRDAEQKAQAQKEAAQRAQLEAQKRAQAQKLEARRKAQIESQLKAQQAEAQKRAQQEALKAQQLKAQQEKLAAEKKALEAKKALEEQKARETAQKAEQLKAQQEAQRIAQEQKAKEIQKSTTLPTEPEVQKPQADEVQTPDVVITEEIDKTEAVSEPIPENLKEGGTKVSFVEIIKDKLAPLKPYYYIIIDNMVLAIATVIAIAGILMLILINKKKKKGPDTNMETEQILDAMTEKSDLEALKNDINSTNPIAQNVNITETSDNINIFKDDLNNLANEYETKETYVKTIESEPVKEEYEEPYIEPVVLSSVEIAPNRGFMIIDRQGIKALFGFIHDEVFLLYQFREYIANYDIKFRISEKQDDKTFFIVKIDKFKLLIRVTSGNMKLELEM